MEIEDGPHYPPPTGDIFRKTKTQSIRWIFQCCAINYSGRATLTTHRATMMTHRATLMTHRATMMTRRATLMTHRGTLMTHRATQYKYAAYRYSNKTTDWLLWSTAHRCPPPLPVAWLVPLIRSFRGITIEHPESNSTPAPCCQRSRWPYVQPPAKKWKFNFKLKIDASNLQEKSLKLISYWR